MTGIYIIKNLIDGKVYIGQSKNVEYRLRIHKAKLRHGAHYNTHLQRAFHKYGEKAFKFGVVCKCSEDELDERERGWIDWYRSTDRKHGYNHESGGRAQKTISAETRRAVSEANKRRIVTDETRRKLSEAGKGRIFGPRSDEWRRKQSEAHKGITYSDETRRKVSEAKKLYWSRKKSELLETNS